MQEDMNPMTNQEIKKWLDRHDIDPIENAGGNGGPIYALTESELLEFIQFITNHSYQDTEADGIVFCGKCGKMKE